MCIQTLLNHTLQAMHDVKSLSVGTCAHEDGVDLKGGMFAGTVLLTMSREAHTIDHISTLQISWSQGVDCRVEQEGAWRCSLWLLSPQMWSL